MVEANLDAALEMANKWREVSGQEILSAWIPSTPREPNVCLLARAFNRNCAIRYESMGADSSYPMVGSNHRGRQMISGEGIIDFYPTSFDPTDPFDPREQAEENAKLFAETFGLKVRHSYAVVLPDEIALVAWEFDHGAYAELEDRE